MEHRQPLTIDEVQGATRPLLGGTASARLLEAKHRNQVFAVGEEAIFKAYLCDGPAARQARKVAALRFLEGRGLPAPRLLGHGVLPQGPQRGAVDAGDTCRRRQRPTHPRRARYLAGLKVSPRAEPVA